MKPRAIFIINLLQDVHVLRPLVFMAARDFGFDTRVLVSDRFRARDTSGAWLNEIDIFCGESGATYDCFADDWDAHRLLTGRGLLFAAAESSVPNHAVAHNIFRHAPAGFLKVTVQHGFECIGLRHGSAHTRSVGQTASFAADLLCTWYGLDQLVSLAPSQAPKVLVTGPTSVLQVRREPAEAEEAGLVCENLHSVRFGIRDELDIEFMRTFRKFALALGRRGSSLRLRPHPAGQYSARSKTLLPRNVKLENPPLYRVDLRKFAYGISPPSSVLIDLLLADVPTAVWQDERGLIDVGNYAGLPTVSSASEMMQFARQAQRHPNRLLAEQRAWLGRQGMPLDPQDVYRRYSALFEAADRMHAQVADAGPQGRAAAAG